MQGDSALGRALGLVRELRQRCPWDRAQTPQTLRPYLVEEALELDHAIQTDDPEAMRDELGDLLLHLAFQIVIGEERSQFNAEVGTRTGLPPNLPPLLMAYRLQERAAGIGFDWPDAKGPMEKVKEEIGELEKEQGAGRREQIEEELGDLLFATVNLARKLGIEAGQALERANLKFQQRFEKLEKLAEERGLEMGRASLEELDGLWNEVKQRR